MKIPQIPQVHLKNRKLSLLANIGVQIGIFVLLTVLTAGAGEAFSALGALADAATTGVRAMEAGEEGVEMGMVGVREVERETAVEGGGAARVHVGVGPAGGGGGAAGAGVGVSSAEEGGAQGGFTIGKAPTIKDRLDLARRQWGGLKNPKANDWHIKVYSVFNKDPEFKGNIEAQLDYLEKNGFRDMNPPSFGKQYKPITTREEAEERLKAMGKKMAKNNERTVKWQQENPDLVKISRAKRHRNPLQGEIELLQQRQRANGFLSPENQARLEELLEQRKAESLDYKQRKATDQAFERMLETGEKAFPRIGVFPRSSAAEGGGGGVAAAAPGVVSTGEEMVEEMMDDL